MKRDWAWSTPDEYVASNQVAPARLSRGPQRVRIPELALPRQMARGAFRPEVIQPQGDNASNLVPFKFRAPFNMKPDCKDVAMVSPLVGAAERQPSAIFSFIRAHRVASRNGLCTPPRSKIFCIAAAFSLLEDAAGVAGGDGGSAAGDGACAGNVQGRAVYQLWSGHQRGGGWERYCPRYGCQCPFGRRDDARQRELRPENVGSTSAAQTLNFTVLRVQLWAASGC
jgi:hypothetical protein